LTARIDTVPARARLCWARERGLDCCASIRERGDLFGGGEDLFSVRKRLDDDEVELRLSAATGQIPGLNQLQKRAARGGPDGRVAQQLLSDTATDALNHYFANTDLIVVSTPTMGVFGSAYEPSVNVQVRGSEESLAHALAGAVRFGRNFSQKQVHVLRNAPDDAVIGADTTDGSRVVPFYTFELKQPLSAPQVQKLAKDSRLEGFTIDGNKLEIYYAEDIHDTAKLRAFKEGIQRAEASLGNNGRGVTRTFSRLWSYGKGGPETVPYDRVPDKLPATPERRDNPIARRIAARLVERDVVGAQPASRLTPEQDAYQTRVADEFSRLPLDDLENPSVNRAYTALAAELKDQYRSLPVRVETWPGKEQPYENSAAMRRDIFDNNHLFIFGTDKNTFGPKGAKYSDDHPLLQESSFKDVNGRRLLVNDLLRAVHDYFAHTMSRAEFGPLGEEAAWRIHMEMTRSPWARWALTTETRGQNSWVNFGPHREWNRAHPKETRYC